MLALWRGQIVAPLAEVDAGIRLARGGPRGAQVDLAARVDDLRGGRVRRGRCARDPGARVPAAGLFDQARVEADLSSTLIRRTGTNVFPHIKALTGIDETHLGLLSASATGSNTTSSRPPTF